jgi:hypothetical protein
MLYKNNGYDLRDSQERKGCIRALNTIIYNGKNTKQLIHPSAIKFNTVVISTHKF